jgi:hypothetical protein
MRIEIDFHHPIKISLILSIHEVVHAYCTCILYLKHEACPWQQNAIQVT